MWLMFNYSSSYKSPLQDIRETSQICWIFCGKLLISVITYSSFLSFPHLRKGCSSFSVSHWYKNNSEHKKPHCKNISSYKWDTVTFTIRYACIISLHHDQKVQLCYVFSILEVPWSMFKNHLLRGGNETLLETHWGFSFSRSYWNLIE